MITQDRLQDILHYDPNTGIFTRRVMRNNRFPVGSIAGTLDNTGYLHIGIDGRVYQAHRLAFIYMTGTVPEEVDHVNKCKIDNRWSNLSGGTKSMNQRNAKRRVDNSTGITGITFTKERWVPRIYVVGKNVHLGSFDTLLDAAAARKSAELKYNFHENHGRN